MLSWCIAQFGGQRQQEGERMRSLFSPYPPPFVTYPATQPASRPTTTHIIARSTDLTVLPPSPGPTASGLALARRRPQTIQSGPSGVNRQRAPSPGRLRRRDRSRLETAPRQPTHPATSSRSRACRTSVSCVVRSRLATKIPRPSRVSVFRRRPRRVAAGDAMPSTKGKSPATA